MFRVQDVEERQVSEVETIQKMGRLRRALYRRRLVKWLERHPANGWVMLDARRLMIEGRLKWLDAGCPKWKAPGQD